LFGDQVHGVFQYAIDDGFVDDMRIGGEAVEEGVVAQAVDQAGGSAGEAGDLGDGFGGEDGKVAVQAAGPSTACGDFQAMLNVLGDFLKGQRLEVIAEGDALAKLFEVGLRDFVAEFWLADEDDLQEFVGGRLQIGEHAQFFEDFVGEVLGFVDDDDDEAILGELLNQEAIETHEHGGFVGAGWDGDVKFVADEADQLR